MIDQNIEGIKNDKRTHVFVRKLDAIEDHRDATGAAFLLRRQEWHWSIRADEHPIPMDF